MSSSKYVLLLASLIFYAFGAKGYTLLLILSIGFNYVIGRSILSSSTHSRGYLIFGLCVNIVTLTYYKYVGFLIENINLCLPNPFKTPSILLPLGISFFTFTQIAFLLDIYAKREEKKYYSLTDYSILVSFFPHLIAGPLLHHRQFIPQLYGLGSFIDKEKIYKGVVFLIIGLCKKVLFADPLGQYAQGIFSTGITGCEEAWLGSLSFSLQLFLDFSGYSDMAIGLALMLQLQIPQNFNAPYRALDIQDFWRRWHISLSDFLKNYLYIPLGGNRDGLQRTIANILITFSLGGLWHGAKWTFVIWGLLNGVGIIFYRMYKKMGYATLPMPVAWCLTMIFVNTCWVFFKADTVTDAFQCLMYMYDFSDFNTIVPAFMFYAKSLSFVNFLKFLVCVSLVFFGTELIYEKLVPKTSFSVALGIALSVILFKMRSETIFLYFNF